MVGVFFDTIFVMILLVKECHHQVALLQNNKHDFLASKSMAIL